MKGSIKARITGLGSYLPKKVLTNADLEKLVTTTDEWIVSRTGIKERRIAEKDETPSTMGALAANKALERAGLSAKDLDIILTCTMTPDYISPATAALIQTKIGASTIPAVDLQAACTGFLYGLSAAKAYVESGMYNTVLVVATEKMSSVLDYQDRNTCILFGDGASAAIVRKEGDGFAIETVCLGSDGELADLVKIPAGGACMPASIETVSKGLHYFKMEGKEVFKHAVRRMSLTARECLERVGLQETDVSWLVPHQANERIMDAIAKNFNISGDKVYKTIQKYGNTSASGIAIALDELTQEYQISINENLLLVAFGGGLTWGAAILKRI